MSALGAFGPGGASALGASVSGLAIVQSRASSSSPDARNANSETERAIPATAPSGVPAPAAEQSANNKLATADEQNLQNGQDSSQNGLAAEQTLLVESRILGSDKLDQLFPSEDEVFDAQEALDEQASRIAELVQRFEEVLQRIDDFVSQFQLDDSSESSIDPKEEGAPSRTGLDPALVGLYRRADSLFEDILLASKQIPGINGEAIQTVLDSRGKVSAARPRLNVVL